MIRGIYFFTHSLLAVAAFFGGACSRFNFPLSTTDRLLVAASGNNAVQIYAVNSSTGGLTLQNTLSLTSPSFVVSNLTNGTFFVSLASGSLLCYRYDMRRGTGPTLESTTPLGVLTAVTIPIDGKNLVYGKSGSGTVFWRSLDHCSLGSEESVTRSGGTQFSSIHFSDSGTAGSLMEATGTILTGLSRNVSTGAITVGNNVTVTFGSRAHMLPGGEFALYERNGGVGTWDLSSPSAPFVATTGSPQRVFPLSDTRVAKVRIGAGSEGVTVSSTGALTVETLIDYGVPTYDGGGAMNPERTFIYTGESSTPAVWVHAVQSSSPFMAQPTQVLTTVTPTDIAYVRTYTRQ